MEILHARLCGGDASGERSVSHGLTTISQLLLAVALTISSSLLRSLGTVEVAQESANFFAVLRGLLLPLRGLFTCGFRFLLASIRLVALRAGRGSAGRSRGS
ncbi:hypothetical protein SRABI128_02352 [Microbacterium sp. Bi128]|nr:hypothetical protein SRABI128_02352 [Microbacterium sp. Bi128]